jgi:hypothetical protein
MGLAQDIESKVREAVAANEAENYSLAAMKLRSAILLMSGHPKIKSEDGANEIEYVRDDLVAMLQEVSRMDLVQRQKGKSSGGLIGVPIRTR